ncbi:small glutamine-rich tetratricopeptide repeat-containing protein beta isoform X2 [Aplysia californica]|uniref:Small glutamine-rich tetratricopeptide repeat-containing protein beta isoform X1 n=1 Tax=Aplysia californica TaxID=6500 RepID=A0ABM0K1R8_APLCA|nr:small glutamine-rich tetratricopeptide repeat-containing protein beta isoform X1 [Aplysia californica]XP_005106704.1 small glutamine-rich tetratricopeptide repeat-containing protein beta isoform X2 [Aplysia californica]
MKTKAEQCKEEGNKCMKENKHTEAVIHYTEAIKHEPNSAVLYSNRSLAFLKIDQLYFALDDAEKAIKLEPSWPKGFFRKGEVEFKGGNYTKALMSYRQAQLLDPTDEGITAAITKATREFARDKKDAARKPVLYSCIGLTVGVLIVAADSFLTVKPAIPHVVLQVLLVAGCGGIGFVAAKIYRYLTVSQRDALLEEPIDLLKEMGDDDGTKESSPSSSTSSHKHHSQAAGRQRMKKGKS